MPGLQHPYSLLQQGMTSLQGMWVCSRASFSAAPAASKRMLQLICVACLKAPAPLPRI